MKPSELRLPPFREVNHTIPLIDPNKKYDYYHPRCPEALRGQLLEKTERYCNAGWWECASVSQAAPLLCIPKKNGTLRTALDAHQRNANTIPDITPLPDQDQICMDVARAKYRTKIDLSDAYEQVCIVPEDVHKTGFSTIYGTFVSQVMQIGDCNAPSTFQRLMTFVFRTELGICVHVYLDDIFVFSYTIEEHENALATVLQRLKDAKLYLTPDKFTPYAEVVDCLGHRIDDRGLHADSDKMARVRTWCTPRNYNDVQRFLGLVQYLAHFMPDVSAYTSPLSGMCANGRPFVWRELHQKCFDSIKALACKSPILKPIDPQSQEPIWVICDASTSGVGAVYGQGPEWQKCHPAGLMSRKFTSAQRSYFPFELEALAIMEALLKWEDKLLGRTIRIVTDHKALTFFNTKLKLSARQERWSQYIQRFRHTIEYVKGIDNKVSDCLSRYFENDTWEDVTPRQDLVNADVHLDPDGDDLPSGRLAEVHAMHANVPVRCSC